MKYEEVCKSLLSDFPDIEKWEDDSELSEREKLRPYYLAVCFIFYLGRKFYQGELEIVRSGFSFIEKMFVSSDNSTKKLAKSGYLVNIYFAIKKGDFPDLFKNDKFLEFVGAETKIAWFKLIENFENGNIKDYYPNVVTNSEICSIDESNILDIRVVGNNLYLGIDALYYFRSGKCTTMENDGVDHCYLVIKDYKLISERPIGEYTKSRYYQKNQHCVLKQAKKEGKSLYTSFDNFLHNNDIGVQDFDYDYEKNTICISGYGNSQTNSVWVNLTFQFSNLYLYWNDQFLNHEYDGISTYKK